MVGVDVLHVSLTFKASSLVAATQQDIQRSPRRAV
ncbi:hypothetical protein SM11_pC1185 (plasmid) [Sinorhizobium meliloti SM11]|uniref:Uncharacterized protein n=1 Tax=Sinorhizobium meliloti (strain SM11) TaxID=707241 RepID=F7XFD3_SINMM|nr:hypothetical protein SM11_pC1185 [Sinorhizobium meliloti SM11]